tara:strand:- start:226 stop:483 length:258 start_codon:yes stop_codon:yes gene_type:complete
MLASGLAHFQGRSGHRYFCEVDFFVELSDMTDERRVSTPTPYLRTGPATMLTAIGLCVLLMIMQLMPEMRDAGPHRSFAVSDASR